MYFDKLNETLCKWLSDENSDEWLFESFRESEVKTLSPVDAFSVIGETVNILLHQSDESASIEILETILCLARTSGTTEVPQILAEKKERLKSHFSDKCNYAKQKLLELFKYYRI